MRSTYNTNVEFLNDRLEDLQDAIAAREPTWWETVESFFIAFFEFIRTHLRVLWNGLMVAADNFKNHGILGAPARLLLALNKTINKLLTPKENIYITSSVSE